MNEEITLMWLQEKQGRRIAEERLKKLHREDLARARMQVKAQLENLWRSYNALRVMEGGLSDQEEVARLIHLINISLCKLATGAGL